MTAPSESGRRAPTTARGRATRDRIVAAAAGLIYQRGAGGTSLDDIRAASGTSKSQLYHYFADKSAIVCAVVAWQQEAVLTGQEPFLDGFSSLAELHLWRDRLIAVNAGLVTYGGCPLGGLASEVASTDLAAGRASAAAFEEWRARLARGLQRTVDRGELRPDVDTDALALGLLAAVQGGLLLSQVAQDVRPLVVAVDHALAAVESMAVPPQGRGSSVEG